MTPTFSCLIATCGDEHWEELAWSRAYPSARSQGFSEVIVQHHPGLSVSEARNRTLADGDTDYVVFLDADDELEPGYLDVLRTTWIHGAITEDWLPMIAPAVRYVAPTGRVYEEAAIPNRGGWPGTNELVIGTALPRLRLLELGGFEKFRAWEDWATFLKLAAAGTRIVYAEDAVYRAHVSSSGRNQVADGPRLRDEIVSAHRDWAAAAGYRPIL